MPIVDNNQENAAVPVETSADEPPLDEPPMKRLRYSEPDLKVIVKSVGEDGQHVEKEYQLYAAVLAKLSTFFDAVLSNPMREASENAVVLQDVAPNVFEEALVFEEDTTAARRMTVEDVIKVVEFYDKFEFTGGLKLCNCVLVEYFKKHLKYNHNTPPDDLDQLIDAVMLSKMCNLKAAFKRGSAYIRLRMCQNDKLYGPAMFAENHVKKLQPLFVEGLLPIGLVSSMSEEELASPLFPKFFVRNFKGYEPDITNIELVAPPTVDDFSTVVLEQWTTSQYGADNEVTWNGQASTICVETHYLCDDDWCIVCRPLGEDGEEEEDSQEGIVLWTCPYSRNLDYPPTGPWIPVDKHASGNPKIKHTGWDSPEYF